MTCPACHLTCVIGLIAWPVKRGGRGARTIPRDQVPSERELAQLRASLPVAPSEADLLRAVVAAGIVALRSRGAT